MKKSEAKRQGLKRYFTGIPCKHNHTSERSTATGRCLECDVEQERKYRQENRNKIQEQRREQYQRNSETQKQQNSRYYQENREHVLERSREWTKNNSDKRKVISRRAYHKNPRYTYEYSKRWRKENKEQCKSTNNNWRKRNPHLFAHLVRKRQIQKEQAVPKWFEQIKVKALFQKRNELNRKWGTKFEVEHIIPLRGRTVCGLHCWDNLQLLDGTLNREKYNNYQADW